jgi:hypothetical protein
VPITNSVFYSIDSSYINVTDLKVGEDLEVVGTTRSAGFNIVDTNTDSVKLYSLYDEVDGRVEVYSSDMGKNIEYISTAGRVIGSDAWTKQAFFGNTPIVRPASVTRSVDGIYNALVSLGLIKETSN